MVGCTHTRFGLSYSSSKLSDFQISGPTLQPSFKATVLVRVTNTGTRSLREVVQVYVEYPTLEGGLSTPRLQLRGFTKTDELVPKGNQLVKIVLDKYALAYWDVERKCWRVERGVYKAHVGKSSEELSFVGEIKVDKEMNWTGI
jgi:beta-glucosidase